MIFKVNIPTIQHDVSSDFFVTADTVEEAAKLLGRSVAGPDEFHINTLKLSGEGQVSITKMAELNDQQTFDEHVLAAAKAMQDYAVKAEKNREEHGIPYGW